MRVRRARCSSGNVYAVQFHPEKSSELRAAAARELRRDRRGGVQPDDRSFPRSTSSTARSCACGRAGSTPSPSTTTTRSTRRSAGRTRAPSGSTSSTSTARCSASPRTSTHVEAIVDAGRRAGRGRRRHPHDGDARRALVRRGRRRAPCSARRSSPSPSSSREACAAYRRHRRRHRRARRQASRSRAGGRAPSTACSSSCASCELLGVRRVAYTDIARDGMQTGVNYGAYRALADADRHPDHRLRRRLARSTTSATCASIGPQIEGVIVGRALYEDVVHARRRRSRPARGGGLSAHAHEARHPVPRRPRGPRRQGRQLRRAARRGRPGRARRRLRQGGRRRARLPRHHRHATRSAPSMLDVATPHRRGGLHPVHGRRRDALGRRHPRDARRPAADKISLNSAAVRDPQLITRDGAASTARQCIVVAIDARRVPGGRERWEVFINGGRINTGIDAIEWAARGRAARRRRDPAHEHGPRRHERRLRHPAHARGHARASTSPSSPSGGAGELDHFAEVVVEADADAVLAASTLHYGKFTVRQVKEAMAAAGIPVRL